MRLKHRTQSGLSCLLLLSILIGLFLYGCDEALFAPKDDEPEVKDYRAWFWQGANRNAVYSYHTLTKTIDSAETAWTSARGVKVSHDGSLLYLSDYTSVKVVDTASFALVAELPHAPNAVIAVSPDGNYLVTSGDSLRLMQTSDYSTVYAEYPSARTATFSTDSRTLYAASTDDSISVISYDEGWSRTLNKDLGHVGLITSLVVTPNQSKWLICTYWADWMSEVSSFFVYDVNQDSIVYDQLLRPGGSGLVITPDGKQAFYGNPGSVFALPPNVERTHDFTVFDVELNQINRVVSTLHFVDNLTPEIFPVKYLAVTPDGKYLLAAFFTEMLMYDITMREFVDYHYFSPSGGFTGFSIQSTL